MAKLYVTARAKTSETDNRPDEQLKPVDLWFITRPNNGTWEGYFELFEEGKRWEDIYPKYGCGVSAEFTINTREYRWRDDWGGVVTGLEGENVVPKNIYLFPTTNICGR